MLPFIIAGIVLVGLGIYLLLLGRRAQGHLLEIKFLKTMPVEEITELQRSVAGELGTGGFSQLVETRGAVGCDEPLTGELSGKPCAYYRMQVEERYEEEYTERDAQGRETRHTRTGSQTVASNTRSGVFFVKGNDGRIIIRPEGADLDLQKVVDHFEPAGGSIGYGGFSLNLSGGPHHGRRVLGYHYSESILPLGANVFVIGQACDAEGELVIKRPDEKEKPFIISMKSEEEITSSMNRKTRWLMAGGVAAIAIGLFLVIGRLLWF